MSLEEALENSFAVVAVNSSDLLVSYKIAPETATTLNTPNTLACFKKLMFLGKDSTSSSTNWIASCQKLILNKHVYKKEGLYHSICRGDKKESALRKEFRKN